MYFDAKARWFVVLLMSFAIAPAAHPQDGQSQSDARGAQIEKLMQLLHDRGQFDGAVLVAQHGQTIYRGAFGFSDQAADIAFKPETPSCLASVSKPFTAIAIMMLAENHALSYDDKIGKYFPELPPKLGAATVRQLLNHTSGIPDYSSDLAVDHPGITAAEVLAALRTVDQPLFPLGEKFQYSNTGYVLLGAIVEKLSGKSLPAYLQERVFDPLKMKSTFALTAGRSKTRDVARGTDDFGSPNDTDTYLPGDGGLYSTVDDLLAFDQALYTTSLVQPQTLNEAFTPPEVRTGKTTYGFGWNITDDPNAGKRVWHTGNSAGFRAFIERRLESQTTVIMLTNHGSTKRVEINQAIQDILAGKSYSLPLRSVAVAMRDIILKSGIDVALARYQTLKVAPVTEYDLGEGELNLLGYRLLYEEKRPKDAVKVFTLNATEHPLSSNAYDSLAEAYEVSGDKASAKKNYAIALAKDSTNLHARKMLEKIR